MLRWNFCKIDERLVSDLEESELRDMIISGKIKYPTESIERFFLSTLYGYNFFYEGGNFDIMLDESGQLMCLEEYPELFRLIRNKTRKVVSLEKFKKL